jgi:hypothetical protein
MCKTQRGSHCRFRIQTVIGGSVKEVVTTPRTQESLKYVNGRAPFVSLWSKLDLVEGPDAGLRKYKAGFPEPKNCSYSVLKNTFSCPSRSEAVL